MPPAVPIGAAGEKFLKFDTFHAFLKQFFTLSSIRVQGGWDKIFFANPTRGANPQIKCEPHFFVLSLALSLFYSNEKVFRAGARPKIFAR